MNAFKKMNDNKLAVVAADAASGQMNVTVEDQKWFSTKPLVGLGVGLVAGALGVVAYTKFSKS